MNIEATMKQWLEALENYKDFIDDAHIIEGQWHWIKGLEKAADSLRQAIAEAEKQEAMECETCKGKLCIGEGTKDDPIRSCPSCNPKAQQRKPLTEQGDDESEEKNI